MADTSKNNTSSDEIDLGQLFQLIGKGFNAIFRGFLRFFLFVKKNIFILLGLGVLGILIGFGLKKIVSKKMKIEVIVKPNLESKEYLYDVVNEIQANIWAKNTSFFDSLEIKMEEIKGLKITVESLGDKDSKLEDELKYLELLKGLNVTSDISEIIKNDILSRNSLNHRIVFTYPEKNNGYVNAKKLLAYINSNAYFKELLFIYNNNAKSRIAMHEQQIAQLDTLVKQYSKNLSAQKSISEGRIVLDAEENIDIRALLDLKTILLNKIELSKIELQEQTEPVKIVNFGNPHEIIKPFFGKTLVLLPLLFIGGFFLISILIFLNKKAGELN